MTAMFAYLFYGQVMMPMAIAGAAMIISSMAFLICIKVIRQNLEKRKLKEENEEEKQSLADDNMMSVMATYGDDSISK